MVGSTADGTDIQALVRSVDGFRKLVMVIGGIHGNEPVSPPTVRGLVVASIPADVEVWLIPELNPDGVAAGTRWNAADVDLNRNFDWDWRATDGGPFAFSEAEAKTVAGLINAFTPDLVVWVHQPYGYVSAIGDTDSIFEEAWAEASGLPVRPDVTQHGGGESWTAFVAERPSILVEIDSWEATPEIVATQRAGFEAVVAALT